MSQPQRRRPKMSLISVLHYYKLVFRSLLLLGTIITCLVLRPENATDLFTSFDQMPFIMAAVWILFVVEMILRFFPSRLESMGCQKQFKKNYIPTGREGKPREENKGVGLVILSWIALNAVIGAMYYTHVIDECVLLVISLAYSVCDMICILFFCPFQTWMMKNKCCGSCRIYNWDYAMMFTPLIFVRTWYTWSLLGLALLLLITWELFHLRHPERFAETTNAGLACANCPEKLCHHKKQLHRFWKTEKQRLQNRLKRNANSDN